MIKALFSIIALLSVGFNERRELVFENLTIWVHFPQLPSCDIR